MAKYKFSNHLMFAIVMQNENLCRQFIERLFPGRKVKEINMLTTEKTIISNIKSKSVRLDVLFIGDEKVYDIEMQVEDEEFLPQRSRYYHSSMDTHLLNKGAGYEELRESYVIFICLHDPVGKNEPMYFFEMYDRKLDLKLGDGSFTILLDVKCPSGKIPKELESFFDYVAAEKIDDHDEFIKEIHQRVEEANQNAEVVEIMTLEEDFKARSRIAYKQGLAEGEQSGFTKGEQSGIEKGKQSIIEKMRASGMSEEQIAQILG